MNKKSTHLKPHVELEFNKAIEKMQSGLHSQAFKHYENAHVLGQESTFLHVKAHVLMLKWALIQKQPKEFLGQLFRIVGAATKTVFGLVPIGNTGGANISPFKPLPLIPEHEEIIKSAKA